MKLKLLILSFIISALGYSITRDHNYSVWIKPVPVLCCLLILLGSTSWNRSLRKFVLVGLLISMAGDIALDLSATSLGISIFTLVMSLYGYALYQVHKSFSFLTLIPTLIIFGGIYAYMYSQLGDRQISAAIYQLVLIWMVWRGAAILNWKTDNHLPNIYQRWLIFLGTLGIALNGVLYGVDLYLFPIPRDLVIHSYYVGQLMLVLGILSGSRASKSLSHNISSNKNGFPKSIENPFL